MCAKGMTTCASSCLHYQSVMDYRAARHADELFAEAVSGGYATEYDEIRGQLITFKKWLMGTAGSLSSQEAETLEESLVDTEIAL